MHEIPSSVSILSLPNEMLTHIFSSLSLPDVANCQSVCSFFSELGNSYSLWKSLCERDLAVYKKNPKGWKETYRIFSKFEERVHEIEKIKKSYRQLKQVYKGLKYIQVSMEEEIDDLPLDRIIVQGTKEYLKQEHDFSGTTLHDAILYTNHLYKKKIKSVISCQSRMGICSQSEYCQMIYNYVFTSFQNKIITSSVKNYREGFERIAKKTENCVQKFFIKEGDPLEMIMMRIKKIDSEKKEIYILTLDKVVTGEWNAYLERVSEPSDVYKYFSLVDVPFISVTSGCFSRVKDCLEIRKLLKGEEAEFKIGIGCEGTYILDHK